MKPLALVLALCTGCSLYFGDATDAPEPAPDDPPTEPSLATYQLSRVRAIAGELPIVGIDSDLAGGVWIAYRKPTADYYENAEVHIVHLDAAGTELSDWIYTDEYTLVQGLAFDGTSLWLNYNSNTTADYNHLRKLDAETGDTLGAFATEAGIVDVTTRGDKLVLSRLWNQLITLDATTGGELSRVAVDGFTYSTQEGIAAWGDRTWVASRASAEVSLIAANGTKVGRGVTSELADWNYDDIRLAWDGSMLLMTTRNQILWLAPIAQ